MLNNLSKSPHLRVNVRFVNIVSRTMSCFYRIKSWEEYSLTYSTFNVDITSKLAAEKKSRIICPNPVGSIAWLLDNLGALAAKVSTRHNLNRANLIQAAILTRIFQTLSHTIVSAFIQSWGVRPPVFQFYFRIISLHLNTVRLRVEGPGVVELEDDEGEGVRLCHLLVIVQRPNLRTKC